MMPRSRPPTDDASATAADGDALHTLVTRPTPSRGSSGRFDAFEAAETEIKSYPGFSIAERVTPTDVDRLRNEPIRVISMKDRDDDKTRVDQPRVPLHVQLRSLAELAGQAATQKNLGYFAPPRDPRQARARQVRRYALRTGVALGLAVVIAFAIWLAAGR